MQCTAAVRRSLFTLALLLAATFPAAAQQTGSIAGVVRPAQGEVGYQAGAAGLSAVQVDALRADGGVAATTLTDGQGGFRLFVAPGTYTVVFSVPGWETLRRPDVVVAAGQTVTLDVGMTERAFDLNPITVTASKTEEKALEAPAAVEVKATRDIVEQPASTIAEHVKDIAAVDIIKSGIQGNYVVVRGFNNIFSGATLTLTDNRIAGVPSLRANVLHLNPTSNLDLERIEVVLGPGSALYGPNAANGVIHSITKSPIDYPGGQLSFATGLRQQDEGFDEVTVILPGDTSLVRGQFDSSTEPVYHFEGRYAHRFGDAFGIKLSGQYFQGEEYGFVDTEELESRTLANACIDAGLSRSAPECASFTAGLGTSPEDIGIFRESVRNVARGRDNSLDRYAFDLRADWRPSEDLSLIASGGRTHAGSSVDLTGLGAAQVVDWAYNYGQVRALYKSAFAQVFFNQSDNTDTYLLRSGRPLVDRSYVLVSQVQNQTPWEAVSTNFTYGVDFLLTQPQTDGTINGRNEDDDDITEFGGYVQAQTALTPKLDLMLAARGDWHSRLEDPVFSPRAGLVFSPTQGQSFRATYNRAFSTPTTLNLFLDISGGSIPLPAGLRYDVRAQGTTENGLSYQLGPNGLPMHRNAFGPVTGYDPNAFQPTTTPHVWDEIVAVVNLQDPTLAAFLGSLNPSDADIALDARTLSIAEGRFYATPGGIQNLGSGVPAVLPTITNTFELGYKGLVGERLLVGVNGYYSLIDDFTSALRIVTPNVFLNRADTEAYLIANGMPAAQAQAVALSLAGEAGTANNGIPIGVLTAVEAGGTDPALILTYQNLGRVELFGADMEATVILNNQWEIGAGVAWVSDDEFTANEGTPQEEIIPLNAATFKTTGSVRYRNDDLGFNGMVRGRYTNGFPANSGVYVGEVDAFTTFDLTLGYRIPGWRDVMLTLDVQNVLGEEYQSFVGTPFMGRYTLLRLMYEF